MELEGSSSKQIQQQSSCVLLGVVFVPGGAATSAGGGDVAIAAGKGDVMGGDADDYVLGTFGIPSITAEMGFFGQFIKDWTCQSKGVCFEILKDNSQWIEYIMSHMSTIGS